MYSLFIMVFYKEKIFMKKYDQLVFAALLAAFFVVLSITLSAVMPTTVEISGKIDVTPFLIYFINNVYNKLLMNKSSVETLSLYKVALDKGEITEKESKLWQFVLSAYGSDEFSTKQLEKDFNDVAYATVRSFVMKFEKLGLLLSIRYGSRTKYKVK